MPHKNDFSSIPRQPRRVHATNIDEGHATTDPEKRDGFTKSPSHPDAPGFGYLDPATPPVHAEAAAKTLPKACLVVVRNGSHSFAGMKGCIDLVIASFLESPAKPLDASCADNIKRLPFLRPD